MAVDNQCFLVGKKASSSLNFSLACPCLFPYPTLFLQISLSFSFFISKTFFTFASEFRRSVVGSKEKMEL